MNREIIINIIRFVFLILFQIFILNKINFAGYVNPYLYILFILLFPIDAPKWMLLISAFFLGFFIDIFMHTLGVNMAASVFIAWLRPALIKSILRDKDSETEIVPGIRDFGFNRFFIYALLLTFIHHFILFYLEAFKFTHFLDTFYHVIFSTVFTMFLIIISQYLFLKPEK